MRTFERYLCSPSPWVPAGGGGGLVDSVSGAAPVTSTGGVNPIVGITAATDLAPGSLSAADKTKLDGLTPGAAVASVSGTAPIASSGGTTPAISITAATTVAAGSLSAADKTKLDGLTIGPTTGTTAQRPVAPTTGHIYFDTTLLQYIIWTGTVWIDLPGLVFVGVAFTMPAIGSTVNVNLNTNTFAFTDKQPIRIGKNLFTVSGTAGGLATQITVKNTGSNENVAVGSIIASGEVVIPAGGTLWTHSDGVSGTRTIIVPDSRAATLFAQGMIRCGAGGGGGGPGGGGGFGGATGGGGGSATGGGAGGSTCSQAWAHSLTPGETLTKIIGAGGTGGPKGAAGPAGTVGGTSTFGQPGGVTELSGSTSGFVVGISIIGAGGAAGANVLGGNPGLVGGGGAAVTTGGAAGARMGVFAGSSLAGAIGVAGGSAAGGTGTTGTGQIALNINWIYSTAASATTYCLAVGGVAGGAGAGGARGGGAGGSAGGSAGFGDECDYYGQGAPTNTSGQGGAGGHGGAADGNAGLTAGNNGTAGLGGRGGGGGGSGAGGGAANPTGGVGSAGGDGGKGSDGGILIQIILP